MAKFLKQFLNPFYVFSILQSHFDHFFVSRLPFNFENKKVDLQVVPALRIARQHNLLNKILNEHVLDLAEQQGKYYLVSLILEFLQECNFTANCCLFPWDLETFGDYANTHSLLIFKEKQPIMGHACWNWGRKRQGKARRGFRGCDLRPRSQSQFFAGPWAYLAAHRLFQAMH